jgi:hypothetical protein
MRPLESELRSALARKEAPKGFAERVLARIVCRSGVTVPRRRLTAWLGRHPIPRWAAAAVLACLLVLAFAEYRQRREGERAKARVILALRIASGQLNGTLEEVVQMNTSHARGNSGKTSLEEKEPLL